MNKYPKTQVRTILPDFKKGSFLYAGVYCIFKKKTFMSGASIIIDVPLIIISLKIFIRRF